MTKDPDIQIERHVLELCQSNSEAWQEVLRFAHELTARIEHERGQIYQDATRASKVSQIKNTIMGRLAAAARTFLTSYAVPPPREPVEVELAFQAARSQHAYGQLKSGENSTPPSRPLALAAYDREIATWATSANEVARTTERYWYHEPLLREMNAEVATAFLETVRRAPVAIAKRRTSKLPPANVPLEGDDSLTVSAKALAGVAAETLSKEEARHLLPNVPLVFLDEVGLQVRERQVESPRHNALVNQMASDLVRLGWQVYAGGSGIRGVKAMADLLAIDASAREHLFIECLTGAAIDEHQAHVNKLRLAARVPFLFVGPLPLEFARSLGSECWSVESPGSPQTQLGEWAPPYFRKMMSVPPTFHAFSKVGRRKTTVTFTADGLRLAEDALGFVGAAMWRLFSRQANVWKFRMPSRPLVTVPFLRLGKNDTQMSVCRPGAEIVFRFGREPLVAELVGESAFLEVVLDGLRELGFPLTSSSK